MDSQDKEILSIPNTPFTNQLKFLAILPLSFFLFRLFVTYHEGEPEIVFWLCHLNNLLLCAGILFSIPKFIQLTALWFIVGFVMWFIDLFDSGTFTFSSFLSHFGGLIISLFFLTKTKISLFVWVYSMAWFLVLQQYCRMFTPPKLNINSCVEIWGSYKNTFENYSAFLIFQIISLSLVLAFVNSIIYWLLKKIELKRVLCK